MSFKDWTPPRMGNYPFMEWFFATLALVILGLIGYGVYALQVYFGLESLFWTPVIIVAGITVGIVIIVAGITVGIIVVLGPFWFWYGVISACRWCKNRYSAWRYDEVEWE